MKRSGPVRQPSEIWKSQVILRRIAVIGERQRDAMLQGRFRHGPTGVEQDAAIAAESQLIAIELTESRDQRRLAMDIERVAFGAVAVRLDPVDPDRAAAPGLGGEIARLPPFQRLFQSADAGCRRS